MGGKSAYPPLNRAAQNEPQPSSATPYYSSTPRWGLKDGVRTTSLAQKKPFWQELAGRIDLVLKATMIGLGAAALSQLWRHWLLLWNQKHLLSAWSVAVSDFFVVVTGIVALALAALSALCLCCALIDFRNRFFSGKGEWDPRSQVVLLVGCLVPVLNIVMPGVFLIEIASVSKGSTNLHLLKLVRIWWVSWIASWVAFVVMQLWRLLDGLVALANSVLLAAFVDLVALVCVFISAKLVEELRNTDNPTSATRRWVVSSQSAPRDVLVSQSD